jgi:hypothetical protein
MIDPNRDIAGAILNLYLTMPSLYKLRDYYYLSQVKNPRLHRDKTYSYMCGSFGYPNEQAICVFAGNFWLSTDSVSGNPLISFLWNSTGETVGSVYL